MYINDILPEINEARKFKTIEQVEIPANCTFLD